jgi:hypothetical protein
MKERIAQFFGVRERQSWTEYWTDMYVLCAPDGLKPPR